MAGTTSTWPTNSSNIGASTRTGELNKRLAFDPDTARRLLAEAGYAKGFKVDLSCPNDRFLNAAICTAVASMLAQVGIRANPQVESK